MFAMMEYVWEIRDHLKKGSTDYGQLLKLLGTQRVECGTRLSGCNGRWSIANTPREKCVRCVECYSKEGQKKGRNGTIIGFPLITVIPISAAAVAAYLFVDPCGLESHISR